MHVGLNSYMPLSALPSEAVFATLSGKVLFPFRGRTGIFGGLGQPPMLDFKHPEKGMKRVTEVDKKSVHIGRILDVFK